MVVYKIYPDKKQDHLGQHKAMHRASRKLGATLWITEFQAYLSQQFNSRMNKDNIQFAKLIEKFESHQHKEQFLKDISQTQKINRFCEASQKNCCKIWTRHSQTQIFELRENSTKLQCFRLQFLYANKDYLLQLREKFEVQAESYNISKGQLRFQLDPWLHHWQEFQSRTKAWPIWETNYVLQGERHAKKKQRIRRTGPSSDNSLKMESRWRTPKIVGIYRYRRERNHVLRPNCSGEARTIQLRKLNEFKIQSIGLSR